MPSHSDIAVVAYPKRLIEVDLSVARLEWKPVMAVEHYQLGAQAVIGGATDDQ